MYLTGVPSFCTPPPPSGLSAVHVRRFLAFGILPEAGKYVNSCIYFGVVIQHALRVLYISSVWPLEKPLGDRLDWGGMGDSSRIWCLG